jgi:hypothetical protein
MRTQNIELRIQQLPRNLFQRFNNESIIHFHVKLVTLDPGLTPAC